MSDLFKKHPSKRKTNRKVILPQKHTPEEFAEWLETTGFSIYQVSNIAGCRWQRTKRAVQGHEGTCDLGEDGKLYIPNIFSLVMMLLSSGELVAEDDPEKEKASA